MESVLLSTKKRAVVKDDSVYVRLRQLSIRNMPDTDALWTPTGVDIVQKTHDPSDQYTLIILVEW